VMSKRYWINPKTVAKSRGGHRQPQAASERECEAAIEQIRGHEAAALEIQARFWARRSESRPNAAQKVDRAICTDILRFPREFSCFMRQGQYGTAILIPDTVLPVYSGDRAIQFSRAVSSRRAGTACPGGRKAVSSR
jgi:hypothetical protein